MNRCLTFYHILRALIIFRRCGLFLRPLAAESFSISNEDEIRHDYGQTEFIFFDRLIEEMKEMKLMEFSEYQD